MKEAPIQKLILNYLAATRVLAFRMNTGMAKMGGRIVRFGVPGMADIVAYPTCCAIPAVVWIECKATDGRQSELQKSFQKQVEQAGHVYVLAKSLEDVKGVLEVESSISAMPSLR